ncbi:MAG: hypothetical protein KVP17_005122 [Porospora cf. gigantea B]|nr:MAG: hypothetical protein KVP17_005122 [Porospora cf. gigantea B]
MQMLVEQGKIPDFVLCIGDDRSDEDMFASVTKFMQKFIHAEGTPKLAPVDKPLQYTGQEQADNTLERLMRQTLPTSSNSRTKSFPHTRLLSSIAHESAPRYRPGVDCPPPYVVTVTVGRKPSHAGFYVNDPQEVSQLLTGLSEPTTV